MAARPNIPEGTKQPVGFKSSGAARRLIAATLRRYKTYEAAARILRISNRGHLYRMAQGTLSDTPTMKAALKRANTRARRAWRMAKPQSEGAPMVDVAAVQTIREELRQLLRRIDALIPHQEE